MTTSTTETNNGPQNDEQTPEGTATPETPESGSESTAEAEGDTFPRAYVEELRNENKRHRTQASKSTELAQRLVSAYAASTGRLHDPRDLAFSPEFLDADGYPDPAKVNEAVETLIQQRPHLAKICPMGDVGQGSSTETTKSDLTSFGDFLRA